MKVVSVLLDTYWSILRVSEKCEPGGNGNGKNK